MSPLTLSVCLSSMKMLSKGTATGPLQTLGLLPQELKLVTGDTSWKTSERNQVSKALHTLMYSTMDALGLQRFEVPAEYVAATIAMFVAPSNIMVACDWMQSDLLSASAIGNPNIDSINRNPITAGQLYAIILQLSEHDAMINSCRNQFEARVGMAIQKPLLEKINDATSKAKGKRTEKEST